MGACLRRAAVCGWVALCVALPARAADLHVGSGQAYGTIGSALQSAGPSDRILVHAGTYVESLFFEDHDATIEGVDPVDQVVWRASGGSALTMGNDLHITVRALTMDGAGSQSVVVMDENEAELTLDRVVVRNTGRTAVDARNELTVTGCTFSGGTASGPAHIELERGKVAVDGSSFSGGTSTSDAGSIEIGDDAERFTLRDSSFSGNAGSGAGGAVNCEASTCTVERTAFHRNTCSGNGGALAVDASTTTLREVELCDNRATGTGGGVYVGAGSVLVERTTFQEDSANQGGGGLHVAAGSVSLADNHYVGTSTPADGGAVLVTGGSVTSVDELFANTGGTSVLSVRTGSLAVSYALFFPGPVSTPGATLGAGILSGVDPLLTGWMPGACDRTSLVPAGGSPVWDAGDPSRQDSGGGPADIGAFDGEPLPDTGDTGGGDADTDTDADADADTDADTDTDADADTDTDTDTDADTDTDTDTDSDADSDADADPDLDGDGYTVGEDCDDRDSSIHPGAVEIDDDGVDQDCSGADSITSFFGGNHLACGCASPAGGLGPWGLVGLVALGLRRRGAP